LYHETEKNTSDEWTEYVRFEKKFHLVF